MMRSRIFIAGTDTNIGKTYISAGLLSAFNRLGYKTLGIKPVASGCQNIDGSLFNDDTLILQQHSSITLPHDILTPFAFEPPIAPHIAAEISNAHLTVAQLNEKCRPALEHESDISIIEGCGGWYVPLNQTETMADFVIANQFKVILVAGIRLGCINHTLLTYRAMMQDGADVIGWIANCIDPNMDNQADNIISLQQRLPIPCLGIVDYGKPPENVIETHLLIPR